MNKEKKLIPGLPSGFEDRWDKKLLLKKKLLKAIENNFIKFGAEALETPSFEISENIGSFLAEDDANPMSDVFSFQDGEKSITLRYDLSSPLARFVAQNNQELPSIFKRYAIQNVFRNEKAGNGRYREFMQADFDIVGNVNPAQANAELCNLISSTLLDCGLKKDQFTINVSNRKIIQGNISMIIYLPLAAFRKCTCYLLILYNNQWITCRRNSFETNNSHRHTRPCFLQSCLAIICVN